MKEMQGLMGKPVFGQQITREGHRVPSAQQRQAEHRAQRASRSGFCAASRRRSAGAGAKSAAPNPGDRENRPAHLIGALTAHQHAHLRFLHDLRQTARGPGGGRERRPVALATTIPTPGARASAPPSGG